MERQRRKFPSIRPWFVMRPSFSRLLANRNGDTERRIQWHWRKRILSFLPSLSPGWSLEKSKIQRNLLKSQQRIRTSGSLASKNRVFSLGSVTSLGTTYKHPAFRTQSWTSWSINLRYLVKNVMRCYPATRSLSKLHGPKHPLALPYGDL